MRLFAPAYLRRTIGRKIRRANRRPTRVWEESEPFGILIPVDRMLRHNYRFRYVRARRPR